MKRLSDMTEAELRHYTRTLAGSVEAMLPPGPSRNGRAFFVLLFTDDTGPGTAHYCANAARRECIKWLRETADRLERREDTPR